MVWRHAIVGDATGGHGWPAMWRKVGRDTTSRGWRIRIIASIVVGIVVVGVVVVAGPRLVGLMRRWQP
jgi:hypothetical protein